MEQEALFAEERTWRVGELAAGITRAVAGAFPGEVWVRGEIDGLRAPNASGHTYFSLCERNSRRGPTSTIPISLFRQDRARVDRELRAWPDFRLADGLEVRIRGRVQYSYGRVQVVMTVVDPVHTLGRLAADRERVLRALATDGLLEANRRLPVPTLPLHVGLVTSAGSAACEDVLSELEASGFGFRISLTDAAVQGGGAVPALLRALHRQGRRRPDVILLVRGGGSRTDLSTFDDEALARAIAASPVPVLTGIGHEIDTSVADEVAHTSFKTPTACAAGVADLVRLALRRAEAAWAGVADRGGRLVGQSGARLDERAGALVRAANAGVASETARLDRSAGGIGSVARLRLRRADGELGGMARRMARAASAGAAAGGSRLDVLSARAAAFDPARALARGWSVTRDREGRLVRRAVDVAPGATLVTTLAEGNIESTVAITVAGPGAERETG